MYTIRLMFPPHEFEPISKRDPITESTLLLDILFNPSIHNFQILVLQGLVSDTMTIAGVACLYPNQVSGVLNDLRVYTTNDHIKDFETIIRRIITDLKDLPTTRNMQMIDVRQCKTPTPLGLIALFYSHIEEAPIPIPTCILYSDNRCQPLDVLRQITPQLKDALSTKIN